MYNKALTNLFCFGLTFVIGAILLPEVSVCQVSENHPGKIRIGLLVQNRKCVSAINGADLAVRTANEKEGFNGQQFELEVRSMEGPWGTGSKQAVDLVFGENVWALMGSHDGRNAHLVEQAATKSTVVLMSAWSGDPTLAQAFVPWFFNCVPNDLQQSAAIVDEILRRKSITKVVVIYGSDYDSKMRLDNFSRAAIAQGLKDPVVLNYESYNERMGDLLTRVKETGAQCIVLLCQPKESINTFKLIKNSSLKVPLFCSLNILNEDELSSRDLDELDGQIIIPSPLWHVAEYEDFRKAFINAYSRQPGMTAAYAFDGMNLLIEAIRKAGSPEREQIQKSLAKISFKGVTGQIKFDSRGNRDAKFSIYKTRSGVPVIQD